MPNALISEMYLTGSGLGGNGITENVAALRETVERVAAGGTGHAEALLVSQSVALNGIFVEMARRAYMNLGAYPDAAERYLRLAMKAQSQARCTLESLAEIKNPRHVTFAKQVNNANGPQQVNNNEASARVEETPIRPIELLEAEDGQWVDTGEKGKTARRDPAVATVGAVNRPAKRRGKAAVKL